MDMEDAIKKVKEKIDYLANNEDAVRLFEMREMAMCDYTSGINAAERREREKWQHVIAEKDAEIAELRAKLDEKK